MDRRSPFQPPDAAGAGPSTSRPAPGPPSASSSSSSSYAYSQHPPLSSHASYGSAVSPDAYSPASASSSSSSRPLPPFPPGGPSSSGKPPAFLPGQPPLPPPASAYHRPTHSQHFPQHAPSSPRGQPPQPKLLVQPPTSPGQSGPSSAPPFPSGSHILSPFNAPPPRASTTPSATSLASPSSGTPASAARYGSGWNGDWRDPAAADEEDEDEHHGLAYLGAGRRNDSLGAQSSEGRSSPSSLHSDALPRPDGAFAGSRKYRSPSDASSPGGLGASGPPSSSSHQHYGPPYPPQPEQPAPHHPLHSHHHHTPSSQSFHPAPPHPAFSTSSSRSNTPSSQGAYDSSGRPASLLSSSPPSQHSYSSPYPHKGGPALDSSSALSHTSQSGPANSAHSHSTASGAVTGGTPCGACGQSVTGPFVRALNAIYHLDCFRCQDCHVVVAAKFFPVEAKDGRQYPLCERDYFRRLDLICNTCNQALRGSYITACGKKFHVEHFTCSACPTVFGPQDSYYEHDGDVYCHFHYSTRFATKCVGCGVAILKQFVEVNRNQKDECWHPECYMIQKFWNVKLLSRFPGASGTATPLLSSDPHQEESGETAESLKAKQVDMEQQVTRVWTVLSAFEESSAACISEMLSKVSSAQYMEAVGMAEMFIFHVEVLFAAIDTLENHFAEANVKGMSHVREAKLLCRTTVNFFSLLAHTHETESWRSSGITEDLLALVTRLAHYLKILIRIALTGALKLEREFGNASALVEFLDRLARLAHDKGDPTVRRRRLAKSREKSGGRERVSTDSRGEPQRDLEKSVNYGYASLFLVEGDSLIRADPAAGDVPLDLCVVCRKPVEEECARLGYFAHWHSYCVRCSVTGEAAAVKETKEERKAAAEADGRSAKPRRPPPDFSRFLYAPPRPATSASLLFIPDKVFHASAAPPGAQRGFENVSRLEQFSFLLNAALRRLFFYLKSKGVVPVAPAAGLHQISDSDEADGSESLDSNESKLVKSVSLDRKLSSTAAQVPKRSTVVEAPSGRVAANSSVAQPKTTPAPSRQGASPANGEPGLPPPGGRPISVLMPYSGPASSSSSPRPPVQLQQGSYRREQSPSSLSRPDSRAASSSGHSNGGPSATTSVIRPAFARNNTSVRIVNEPQPDSGHQPPENLQLDPDEMAADMLTLGDLPHLIEVEQARLHPEKSADRKLIADLTPVQAMVIKYFALLQIQRSALSDSYDTDEVLDLLSKRNKDFWNKLFKGGKKEKEVKKKAGVFGVPLDQLVDRSGSDSVLGATAAHLKVPTFVEDVIAAMRQMDMSVEGIFRKNGNIRRLKDDSEALDQDPGSVNFTEENPVQLAALLKKFLRDMPEPLLTFRLYRLLCQSQIMASETDRKRYLHLTVCLLPRCNRDMMEILFVFLKWVASFSHVDEETGSKMDLENLATVITPSILYSKTGEPGPAESFKSIKAVTQLLHCQDEFYTVPDELLPYLDPNIVDFFEKNPELPPKDMLKTCSKIHTQIGEHRRTKQQTRTPPLQPPSRNDSAPSRLSSYRSDTNLAETGRVASGTSTPLSNGSVTPGGEHRPQAPGAGPQSRPSSWAQERLPTRPGVQHQPMSNASSQMAFEPSSPRKAGHLPPSSSPMSTPSISDSDPRRSYHAQSQNQPSAHLSAASGRPAGYPRS